MLGLFYNIGYTVSSPEKMPRQGFSGRKKKRAATALQTRVFWFFFPLFFSQGHLKPIGVSTFPFFFAFGRRHIASHHDASTRDDRKRRGTGYVGSLGSSSDGGMAAG